MDNLIEALMIFRKYSDDNYPTHCEHDVLMVPCVNVEEVSTEDMCRLDTLGFFPCEVYNCFISFKFGSC